ncbi:MAG TPA: glycosyl hydrolase [Candidatus Paceibacterota bacterium]|nr:glycosyl hydrolase [Candidatus Paceibacterota bacterium]
MRKFVTPFAAILAMGLFLVGYALYESSSGLGVKSTKLLPPANGIYHGAFPDFGPEEDIVSAKRIQDFEALVGKGIAFAYFSNNWLGGIHFPQKEVQAIASTGATPFIRMMPRSDWYEGQPEPVYSLQKIADGVFDPELQKWAAEAKETKIPLLVEFGTEVNGDWFSWNARWNGREQGAAVFQQAYRHIINLFREENVTTITWVFHVDAQGEPDEPWNSMAAYYPGDEYIDWIGMSVYGAQEPGDDWQTFQEVFDEAYAEFAAISATKPLALLEFGAHENNKKPAWIAQALESISSGRYPRVKAISYWHSNWENDDGTTSRLRLDSSKESLQAYQQAIQNPLFVTEPVFE